MAPHLSMACSIELTQRINAPTSLIWQACVEPRGLSNWQADEAEGQARAGGKLQLHWSAFDSTVELSIIDWQPERRVVLAQGDTQVEFRFDEQLLTLVQHGLGPDDDVEGLRSSWRIALAQLAHCVERHPNRQRRVEWLVRKAAATPELVYLALTDRRLNKWLCQQGTIAAEGERYRMLLTGGQELVGQVLANVPGRDIALGCENVGDAVLVFRTFPSPGQPGERLIAAVWSEWGPPRELADDVIESVDAALERLVNLLERVGSA